jgi:hypothetical protein
MHETEPTEDNEDEPKVGKPISSLLFSQHNFYKDETRQQHQPAYSNIIL